MKEWEETEIVICDVCEGSGELEQSEMEDYHKGIYNYWYIPCKSCNATGRQLKTTSYKFEPYVVEKRYKK